MEIIEIDKLTLKDLLGKAPNGLVILTQDDEPVVVALPPGEHQRDIWIKKDHEIIRPIIESWGGKLDDADGDLNTRERVIALPRKVDPGLLEVSMAIASVAIAVAIFLPDANIGSKLSRVIIAVSATGVSLFSSYGALWLLSLYLEVGVDEAAKSNSTLGLKNVLMLLRRFNHLGPYLLLVLTILITLGLAIFVGVSVLLNT